MIPQCTLTWLIHERWRAGEIVSDIKRCCVARQLAANHSVVSKARNKILGTRSFLSCRAQSRTWIFLKIVEIPRLRSETEKNAGMMPARSPRSPGLFQSAKARPRGHGLNKFPPDQIVSTGLMLSSLANRHLRERRDHPIKVSMTNGSNLGIPARGYQIESDGTPSRTRTTCSSRNRDI